MYEWQLRVTSRLEAGSSFKQMSHGRPSPTWSVSPAPLLGYHIPEHTQYCGSLLCCQSWVGKSLGLQMTQQPRCFRSLWMKPTHKGIFFGRECIENCMQVFLSEWVCLSLWLGDFWHEMLWSSCDFLHPVCAAVWLSTARSSTHRWAAAASRQHPDSDTPSNAQRFQRGLCSGWG